ncbi:deoxyribose-phosphate aldolase [Puia sp.]|uniref:deoxyribose-phosphate aldolase n=1 Tax=Puia sp. TaxID=2045100 RepID=UPI002F41FC75
MLARYIDHTILKPTTSHIEISKICGEAIEYGFAAVCVPPPFVAIARQELGGRGGVKVATVIGFPFGYSVAAAKLAEVEQALADGADELDVVIDLIALKAGDWTLLTDEMRLLTEKIHRAGKIVKVIIESGVLTDEEIIRCCQVYSGVGVDFLKTSTGYAEKGAGATEHAVRLMRAHLPAGIRIKASGGIRTAALAQQLIDAGADRLGCSASVEIVTAQPAAGGY